MLFVGAILCVLGDKLIEAYLHIRDVKELWDPWRPNSTQLMLAANCTLQSSLMITME
jgi:hypothetical protein